MVLASQSLNVGCPDDETLEQFKVGLLTERDLEAIAAHLALCPSCEARLAESERSGPDPLVQQIRKCVAEAPSVGISLSSLLRSLSSRRPAVDSSSAETIDDKRARESTDVEQEAPRIAHYELRELLGSGGMGDVYLAWDTRLQRTVALKVIKAKSHTALNALARFRREAKAIAKLDHPGIVKLYDFGEAEGVDYLCMEHVEGGTLHHKLKGDNKPSYREAAELLRDLALAMQHAHAQNIIHRDLKPGNILLTAEGLPKIADFGLAKLLDEEDTLTRTNVVVGTPVYMGPEQASGDAQRVGPLSDQYALGVILYEMLTGTVPFRGRDNRDTLTKVQTACLLPPSTLRPDVPAQLEAICLRALSRGQDDRYADAQGLAEDLDRFLAGQGPKPQPRLRRVRLSPWTRRLIAAALFMCLLFSACAIYAALTAPDPVAKLKEYEAAMAANQPITLIGEKGYPQWYRWEMGEEKARASIAADGTFALHAWDDCRVELMPHVHWPAYRIHAKVKHDDTAIKVPSVGLYFGHLARNGKRGTDSIAILFGFNDVFDPKTVGMPHPLSGKILGPDRSHVSLSACFNTRFQGKTIRSMQFPGSGSYSFLPSKLQDVSEWRDLIVEVNNVHVRGRFDGSQIEGWKAVEWKERLQWHLNHLEQTQPEHYRFEGELSGSLQGSIGIFLNRGSATFREVSVGPLIKGEQ